MNKEKYLKEIMKNLHCSSKEKKRIYDDIDNDMTIAMQQESIEEIIQRMGSPKEVAEEFNANLGYSKKSHKPLIIACLCIVILLLFGFYFIQNRSQNVEVKEISQSQVFTEEKIDAQIQIIIQCLDQQDYEKLLHDYSSQVLQDSLSVEQLKEAVLSVDDDWGHYQSIKDRASQIMVEDQKEYAVNDVLVAFDNRNVVLRLTFDEDMKLSGIYMR